MGLAVRWGLFCAGRCQSPHTPCSLRSPGLFRGHCNLYCNLSTSAQCWPGFVWTLNPLNQSRPRCWRWLESSLTTCQLGCSLADAGTRPNVPNHPQRSQPIQRLSRLFTCCLPIRDGASPTAGIGTAAVPWLFSCLPASYQSPLVKFYYNL
jgi:hypothetical protein